MITKTCLICGAEFTAKSNKAKYCSTSCRQKAHRLGEAIIPDKRIEPLSAEAHQVASAVVDARIASNELAQLSATAPIQLRPGCARISHAISRAIDAEGW